MNSNNGDMREFLSEEEQKKHEKEYDVALTVKEYAELSAIPKEDRMEMLARMRTGISAQFGKNYFNKKKTNEEENN